MDAARLRHTFRYAGDGDDPDEPEVLDEQEQEALIQTLAVQNTRRNEQFRQMLLAVPALATVPFLIASFSSSSSSSSSRLLPLLGLTSLAATACLLYRQPTTSTGIPALDAWSGGRVDKGKGPLTALSPLDRHLPLLNIGLCVVLLLSLFLPRSASSSSSSSSSTTTTTTTTTTPYLLLSSLPAAVYGVVLLAKVTMAGVDPERDLYNLRYEYKGA